MMLFVMMFMMLMAFMLFLFELSGLSFGRHHTISVYILFLITVIVFSRTNLIVRHRLHRSIDIILKRDIFKGSTYLWIQAGLRKDLRL
jgi:hypothetical protein